MHASCTRQRTAAVPGAWDSSRFSFSRRGPRHVGVRAVVVDEVAAEIGDVGQHAGHEARVYCIFRRCTEGAGEMVRKEGLEPSRCYPQVPETCASTSSATFAGGRS